MTALLPHVSSRMRTICQMQIHVRVENREKMADRRELFEDIPEIRRFLIENVRPTGRTLGVGSYGSVDEVEVDGVVCAAKKIHQILVDATNDPRGNEIAARKYVAECQLMSDLRHQHLVQFLGLCFLEGSSLPAIVMEKLIASLDDILENTRDIPLGMKKSFLVDVIKGLLYLHHHSPTPIIHRDLSARNVLINSAMVAKISDLGNARMVNFRPGQLARTLTRLPGTQLYMPPEALDERALTRYGPSLDIFSFGHLALFTLTQVFPGDLLGPNFRDPNNRKRLIGRTEVERRQPYFSCLYQQLSRGHPLVQLVERCLDTDPEDRPSTQEVLQQLEAVDIEYPYQHLTKLDMIRLLQQQTDSQKDEQVQRLQTQLQQMQLDVAESRTQRDRAVQEKDEIIRGKDAEIQRLQIQNERSVQEKERVAKEKDGVIKQKEQVIRDNEELIQTLLVEVQQEDDLLCQKVPTLQKGRLAAKPVAQEVNLYTTPGAKLVWRECAESPIAVGAARAVLINGIVYVGGGGSAGDAELCTVCRYHPGEDKWAILPPSPVMRFGVGQVSGQLVLVGGWVVSTDDVTGDVHIFTSESQQWEKSIPAMKTARYAPTVVSHSTVLVACGGGDLRSTGLPTVELYSSEARQWFKCPPLPSPCRRLSSVAIGDTLFLMGGCAKDAGDSAKKSVFSASLSTLIDRVIHHGTGSACTQQPWTTLKDVPCYYSTAASIGGCLLALGGKVKPTRGQANASIHTYLSSLTWHKTGELPLPLKEPAAVLLPTNKLLIIGGVNKNGRLIKNVYKGSVEV